MLNSHHPNTITALVVALILLYYTTSHRFSYYHLAIRMRAIKIVHII